MSRRQVPYLLFILVGLSCSLVRILSGAMGERADAVQMGVLYVVVCRVGIAQRPFLCSVSWHLLFVRSVRIIRGIPPALN